MLLLLGSHLNTTRTHGKCGHPYSFLAIDFGVVEVESHIRTVLHTGALWGECKHVRDESNKADVACPSPHYKTLS